MIQPFPKMFALRQNFPTTPPLDIVATVQRELVPLAKQLRPGAQVAVGVGSRGITNLAAIVRATLEVLRAAGAEPFILPAMGSHGGATPEGQRELLAEYGITEAALGVPIRDSMEVEQVGMTDEGAPVFVSVEARRADGILVINRVKPHTDFSSDTLGSGPFKMLVIGLGKRAGAAAFHIAASRLGHERMLRSIARVILRTTPVLGGLGIVEDQYHQTARVAFLPAAELETREAELFREAKALMPCLPFDEVDLLIVDRIGKNISGAGMDPNVIRRGVQGYTSDLALLQQSPVVRRIFVRGLTPETHGNAIGIGMADATTARLVAAMDSKSTYINSLTSLTPQCAKIPVYFETDREAIARLLETLATGEPTQAKVIRITDTLSLSHVEVSESYLSELTGRSELNALIAPAEMAFDSAGNLPPLQ
ncbi:MAG: DUF2088 domain-containing protein [Pedosphaera sp.]|nr:DUF2088 domain-containing protein [Pedosphaera sp.]